MTYVERTFRNVASCFFQINFNKQAFVHKLTSQPIWLQLFRMQQKSDIWHRQLTDREAFIWCWVTHCCWSTASARLQNNFILDASNLESRREWNRNVPQKKTGSRDSGIFGHKMVRSSTEVQGWGENPEIKGVQRLRQRRRQYQWGGPSIFDFKIIFCENSTS